MGGPEDSHVGQYAPGVHAVQRNTFAERAAGEGGGGEVRHVLGVHCSAYIVCMAIAVDQRWRRRVEFVIRVDVSDDVV